MRIFWAAVSRLNGGSGGRLFVFIVMAPSTHLYVSAAHIKTIAV
jgi:hypothetical protein